jgi:SAM-dependent methyltransferase
MIKYKSKPIRNITYRHFNIPSFLTNDDQNIDSDTVSSFGNEWLKFSNFKNEEINDIGDEYFDVVPISVLDKEKTIVLDAGCGSGRWTKYISPKVKFVESIDPSDAVMAATNITEDLKNVRITHASIGDLPFRDNSFDFILCLGVLHHIPDTRAGLQSLVKKLKTGGSILLYLYYDLDNRGILFKLIFEVASILRRLISIMPSTIKKLVCDAIAVTIYLPFIGLSNLLKFVAPNSNFYTKIPLSFYIGKSFNVIRNDALDRFVTPLEKI